ncbi:MAG: hypothetical protein M3N08_07985 [Pseudomonadota bacterium]|nr:hypothetical protein [Pseudomonadota bacterium]
MHGILVLMGVIAVLIILVHIVFKVIKFTVIVFVLGAALVALIYVFQQYFGIDLIAIMTGPHVTGEAAFLRLC